MDANEGISIWLQLTHAKGHVVKLIEMPVTVSS